MPVRGTANDMREHLKHLGPSNLASRPKTTRYNTVKIKPGNIAHRNSISEEPYRDNPSTAIQGGEGEGLLRSAGKEASDGVQAVQQHYGSFDHSSLPRSPELSNKSVQANFDGPSETPVSTKDSTSRPSTGRVGSAENSSDTLGSLPSKEGSPGPLKRRVARSGSITENIIDSGGVRKVVLETNSSSDADDGEATDEAAWPSSKANKSTTSLGVANGHGTNSNSVEAQAEDVKKRRKRRRNRKGGGKGDDAGTSSGSKQ